MLITLQESETRLNSSDNLTNKLKIREIVRKRVGSVNRSLNLRTEIAALAHLKSRKEVAALADCHPDIVSRLKHGRSSDGRRLDPQLRDAVNSKLEKLEEAIEGKLEEARDAALDKLMLALGVITEEKLEKVSPRDASIIASNMARVAQKSGNGDGNGKGVNILIYAPRQKEVEDYKVVEIEGGT